MALKKTSSTIVIGFNVTESGANTFTQDRIDLQLNPLDNEVFVVQSIDLDALAPDALIGVNTETEASLSTTNRTTMGFLSDSNVMAVAKIQFRSGNAGTPPAAYWSSSMEAPPTVLPYLGIISTNDFFIQVEGANNAAAKAVHGKMYGYRAKADSATYAALVQSEVLTG